MGCFIPLSTHCLDSQCCSVSLVGNKENCSKTFGVRSQNSVLEIAEWKESAKSHIWLPEIKECIQIFAKVCKNGSWTKITGGENFPSSASFNSKKTLPDEWGPVYFIFHLVFINYWEDWWWLKSCFVKQ